MNSYLLNNEIAELINLISHAKLLLKKTTTNTKEKLHNYICLEYCCSCSSMSERLPGPTQSGPQTLKVMAVLEPTNGKGP